jgi:hypothetical protein
MAFSHITPFEFERPVMLRGPHERRSAAVSRQAIAAGARVRGPVAR